MVNDHSKVIIQRRLPVPREELFASWIQPATMGLWMCPGTILSAEVQMDLRVGGSLLIVMHDAEKSYEHRGEFTIVDPPQKLAFTWIAQATDFHSTLVSVEFVAVSESESELILTHERFPRGEVRDRYRGGWGQIVSKLEQYLRAH